MMISSKQKVDEYLRFYPIYFSVREFVLCEENIHRRISFRNKIKSNIWSKYILWMPEFLLFHICSFFNKATELGTV